MATNSQFQHDHPVITAVRVRALSVPLSTPLRTASGVMTVAPLLLFDIETNANVRGVSYIFTYTPTVLAATKQLAIDLSALVVGQALAPLTLLTALRKRVKLIGSYGLIDMVLAGIDMALWDAWARHLRQPLVRVLGGTTARPINAYASYGMDGVEQAGRNVMAAAEAGFKAVKIKIGYPTLKEDIAAVRTAHSASAGAVGIMVDYNQSLNVPEAITRCKALDSEGLLWIEEPTDFDDNAGHARIAASIETPLQLGENLYGPRLIATSLRDGASDLMMPDLMKVGGVSGWIETSAICAAQNVPVSNHFYQEVSIHMLAVTPTAHFLEYFAMADPILVDPLRIVDGKAYAPDAEGNGMTWQEKAINRFIC
ncbi:enolase C-terminal domain-like protein [Glaciimonas sp. PCH181]|uniref:enolase C-terminal domain-like protein n=1 Tax=Glaciimonas sp. PCH181 TaxID=2133943 RepID=UPI000D35A688|nr:enolase C-terminal domain-like protein [Glaciimonas sp. PCH181]PUA17114.1 mandelate racemase [Glaciimonas sp. PCH181]